MAWNIKLLSQKSFSKKKKHDLCLVCRSNLLYKHQNILNIKTIEFILILILIWIWNVVSLLFVAHTNNNVAQLFCQLLSLFSKHWAGNNWNRFGKWNSWRNSNYRQHSNIDSKSNKSNELKSVTVKHCAGISIKATPMIKANNNNNNNNMNNNISASLFFDSIQMTRFFDSNGNQVNSASSAKQLLMSYFNISREQMNKKKIRFDYLFKYFRGPFHFNLNELHISSRCSMNEQLSSLLFKDFS